MTKSTAYLNHAHHPVLSIVQGVDRDVERSEDILMLGYSLLLMAPLFAPVAPPKVLLPLMAMVLAISVYRARINFKAIQRKLVEAIDNTDHHQAFELKPITDIFAEHPKQSLTDGFNPLKNGLRTLKSFLGGLLLNPLWMPIFYILGLQFAEEKQIQLLNQAVIAVEEKTAQWR